MSDDLPPPQNHFGLGYVARGDEARARGDLRQAAADYCRAVALDAADAGVYVRLGEAFAVIGDHAQARKALAAALHLAPDDVAVRARVVVVCDEAGLGFPGDAADAMALKGFTPPPRLPVGGVTPTLGQVGPRLPGVSPTLGEVKDLKKTAAPPAKRGRLAKDGFGTTSRTADLLAEFREPDPGEG